METHQSVTQSSSTRERDTYERFPNRPRAATDGSSPRNLDVKTLDVARAGVLPKGFEGMLKTTTETGDIGIFSIKPSRLPSSLNTPRKSSAPTYGSNGPPRAKQSFQPYGVPSVDDRRRLPSYTGAAASDAMSTYDSSSLKSASRTFDEPDYRSYSMTQTSHSSYTLSNHKSYASLRGQHDTPNIGPPVALGNVLQRPRSPFAYPTRLRRPGFRPSSPALTDGGIVDYSRRAEIDRQAHIPGNDTSTPSSLYAMKRRPPHTLRPDGHRSTPSLLSQTSTQRRSSSPLVYPNSGNDWARRNFTTSNNTSPARSTFSVASTTNIRASATATSATNTPGRFPPPSPLYYDYTEDFEVEEAPPPEPLPPPLFTIHKTIPEDRPMSSGSPIPETNYEYGLDISAPMRLPESMDSKSGVIQRLNNDIARIASTTSINVSQTTPAAGNTSNAAQTENDSGVLRLGQSARKSVDHVEEIFKLEPLGISNATIPPRSAQHLSENTGQASARVSSLPEAVTSSSLQTTNTEHYRHSSQPLDKNMLAMDFAADLQSRWSTDLLSQQSRASSFHTSYSRRTSQESIARKELPASSALSHLNRQPLSGNMSNRPGLTGLDGSEMPAEFHAESSKTSEMIIQSPESVLIKNGSPILLTPVVNNATVPITAPPMETAGADLKEAAHAHTSESSTEYRYQPPSTLPDYKSIRVPNFSHRIKASSSYDDTPMLAPKPISPARQLKLKNSIPQLMKALPALPAEPVLSVDSQTAHPKFSRGDMSKSLSPVIANNVSTTIHGRDGNLAIKSPATSISGVSGKIRADISHSGSQNWASAIEEEEPPSPSKLKLKLKTPMSPQFQPHTPLQIKTTDSDDSYPWTNQDTNPATQTQQENNSRLPRFRLKLARSSLKDQGTVRVNRSSTEERPSAGFRLGTPKDLFSPGSGFENMFRQVSDHLHSRKTSTTSNFQPDQPEPSMDMQSNDDTEHLLGPATAFLEPPSIPLASGEAGSSFSDDSLQEEGQDSLRRRLTHLTSKLAVPYASRSGTQSYDDITWKDRNIAENAVPLAARSIPDFHENVDTAAPEVKPVRRFSEGVHRQRLKAKMHGWLKGARAVFASRVKPPRSATNSTGVTPPV